jgi:hypothetical protein
MEFLIIASLTEHTYKPLSTKKPPFIIPLFIGTRAFMRAAKMDTSFAIYVILTSREMATSTNIHMRCH